MNALDENRYTRTDAYTVLDILGQSGQCHTSGLAASLDLSPGTLGGLLRTMEYLDWIFLAEDGSGWVTISPAGGRIVEARQTLRDAADSWQGETYLG
jgi:hypothetical protein